MRKSQARQNFLPQAEILKFSPRLKLILLGGGAGLGCTLLYLINPADTNLFPCPFRALTGLNCPVCGTTRAAHQLLHGNFLAALQLNALFVLIGVPFFLWCAWDYSRAIYAGRSWRGINFSPRMLALIFGTLIVFGLLRNIPAAPFNWFSP